MSLINQMLRDLDARRAAHGVGTQLPNDVRPLPKPEAARLPIVLGSILVVVAVGALIAYWSVTKADSSAGHDASVAPTVAVATPALPPSATATAQPSPAEQTTPTIPLLPDIEGSLRMADSIALPPEKSSEARIAAASRSEKTPDLGARHADEAKSKKESVERPSFAPEPVPAKAAGKADNRPTIERTEAVGTPRERAEGEYRKAIAAVNQGRLAEALESLRNVLRQDSLHVASRQLLVRLLIEAKRPKEAEEVLQDGLLGQPAQLGWAMTLARLQVDRDDLAAAWQTLDQAAPAAGNNADYLGFMAHVLQRLGRNGEAARYFQAAVQLAPGDGRWWLGLGLAHEAEGNPGRAKEMFARARQCGNLGPELIALIEQKLR